MFKNGKLLVMIGAIGFLMGIFLLMGTFSVVQGKELPCLVPGGKKGREGCCLLLHI
jgi:hypothetical protein